VNTDFREQFTEIFKKGATDKIGGLYTISSRIFGQLLRTAKRYSKEA